MDRQELHRKLNELKKDLARKQRKLQMTELITAEDDIVVLDAANCQDRNEPEMYYVAYCTNNRAKLFCFKSPNSLSQSPLLTVLPSQKNHYFTTLCILCGPTLDHGPAPFGLVLVEKGPDLIKATLETPTSRRVLSKFSPQDHLDEGKPVILFPTVLRGTSMLFLAFVDEFRPHVEKRVFDKNLNSCGMVRLLPGCAGPVQALRTIDDLPEALLGISRGKIYIWNHVAGILLKSVALDYDCYICHWLQYSAGLLFLLTIDSSEEEEGQSGGVRGGRGGKLIALNPETDQLTVIKRIEIVPLDGRRNCRVSSTRVVASSDGRKMAFRIDDVTSRTTSDVVVVCLFSDRTLRVGGKGEISWEDRGEAFKERIRERSSRQNGVAFLSDKLLAFVESEKTKNYLRFYNVDLEEI